MNDSSIRPATRADLPTLARALYHAATWRKEQERRAPAGWSQAQVLERASLAKYWQGWGRPGDFGVIAEIEGSAVGAAYARRFTAQDPGYGFVSEDIPEITIEVEPALRSRGIGSALLASLARVAEEAGVRALSLSTEADNPAGRLYRRTGFVEVARHEDSLVMVLDVRHFNVGASLTDSGSGDIVTDGC